MLKKCQRGMYLVKMVHMARGTRQMVWQTYLSFVFCHISYCWPAICDLSMKNLVKFERLEKIAIRWSGFTPKLNLRERLHGICVRLINKVVQHKHHHPLSQFFTIRENLSTLRHQRALQAPPNKLQLFRKSSKVCSRDMMF